MNSLKINGNSLMLVIQLAPPPTILRVDDDRLTDKVIWFNA